MSGANGTPAVRLTRIPSSKPTAAPMTTGRMRPQSLVVLSAIEDAILASAGLRLRARREELDHLSISSLTTAQKTISRRLNRAKQLARRPLVSSAVGVPSLLTRNSGRFRLSSIRHRLRLRRRASLCRLRRPGSRCRPAPPGDHLLRSRRAGWRRRLTFPCGAAFDEALAGLPPTPA